MRSVDTRFWSDGWVRKLNALDRYLFLYLLTNDHTTWCGMYELEFGMMAFECGIEKEDLSKAMLSRLSPKVIYANEWVYVPKWLKYHVAENGTLSPSQKKGFIDAWNKVPIAIRKEMVAIGGIPYAYPMVGVSAFTSSFTSSLASADEVSSICKLCNKNHMDYVPCDEDGNELSIGQKRKFGLRKQTPSQDAKSTEQTRQVSVLMEMAESVRGTRFIDRAMQKKEIMDMFVAQVSSKDILTRFKEMYVYDFWKEHGLNFSHVKKSFDKLPAGKKYIWESKKS